MNNTAVISLPSVTITALLRGRRCGTGDPVTVLAGTYGIARVDDRGVLLLPCGTGHVYTITRADWIMADRGGAITWGD